MANLRPRSIRCARCNKKVKVAPTGRIPVYCGNNCRQIAFMTNLRGTPVSSGDRQRVVMWELLQDAGSVLERQADAEAQGGGRDSVRIVRPLRSFSCRLQHGRSYARPSRMSTDALLDGPPATAAAAPATTTRPLAIPDARSPAATARSPSTTQAGASLAARPSATARRRSTTRAVAVSAPLRQARADE